MRPTTGDGALLRDAAVLSGIALLMTQGRLDISAPAIIAATGRFAAATAG